MIDRSGNKLDVFENFVTDRELPKFKKHLDPENLEVVYRTSGGAEYASSDMVTFNSHGSIRLRHVSGAGPWYRRVWQWIVHLFRRHTLMSVEQFFVSVHNSEREIEIVAERARGYERAIRKASQSGQRALFEQLSAGLNAHKMETQLLAIGMTKYLTEGDLVRFCKKSERGLRLDWVRNFTRQIPDDLLERKERADAIGIFDNYVVLHYDPEAKAWSETKAEEAARKDPILFGLMEGRRCLYFVGDWIDEYCDLTLDQVADAIGKEAVREIE